jgi:D-tagatose-1,6-bisphosphate aldolase subunit GatZ/KbaZ
MTCADDKDFPLSVIASRTVELAKVAEELNGDNLRYVVGSEVPVAGGAHAGEDELAVTTPASARETLDVMKQAFRESDAEKAWERVIALVVQPGVEFGNQSIYAYQRDEVGELKYFIESEPGIIYEAHSTDYQTGAALKQLVEDHFAILKVGPALTFALREAVFALAMMEDELGFKNPSRVRKELESAMLANPVHWQKHYRGSEVELKFARQFSFSDRIRYYWDVPKVKEAFNRLIANFGDQPIPVSLLSQYMPAQYSGIRSGRLRNHVNDLLMDPIHAVLENYSAACSLS